MPIKTNKLNIFLIKPDYKRFDQIVVPDVSGIPIEGVGTFYAEPSHPHTPSWVTDFFGEDFDAAGLTLVSSSARGLLLARIRRQKKERIFAVTFGFGRHLLRDDRIEDQFGLKTVLNSVDHKSIRGVDKTSLGSTPKQTREQMSREADVADFGLDVEQDLVRSVTGKSRYSSLGRTISGRDGLSVSVKVDISNIRPFLLECLERYESQDYKDRFGWIDQIKQVRDTATISELDSEIEAAISQSRLDTIWMGVPEILDWSDVKGFRYQQPKRGELRTDLDLSEFIDSLQGRDPTISVLKEAFVHVISAANDDSVDHWTAYRCLCAEVDHKSTVYVLNAGKWYEIVHDFAAQVRDSFATLPDCALQFPDYDHESEGAYNLGLANVIPNSYCMDAKMIPYGGGSSSIEFCDLATDDKKLIHIKRYSGSSTLSHLFAQGTVSGELFLQEEGFRRELNKKLPRGRKLPNTRIRPIPSQYEIVFAIISKSQNALDIPFFSKVTLKNARRRLEAYNYKVTKKKIQQT